MSPEPAPRVSRVRRGFVISGWGGIIDSMMAAESAQTLERGLRLLRLLAEGHRGRTPTELAGELGLSRPVVYRLLTTLQAEGFARRDADGRVHLGFGVLGLARAVQPLLRATALPVLRVLAERAGATAHLTIAEGDEGLAVAVVEPSWTDMHVAYREGSRHPLTRGAAGLALLALRSGDSGSPGGSRESGSGRSSASGGSSARGGSGDSGGSRDSSGSGGSRNSGSLGGSGGSRDSGGSGEGGTKGGVGEGADAGTGDGVSEGDVPPLCTSHGQLQEGATGIAAPIMGVSWLEASVGVVSFADLDVATVGPLVLTAAKDLAAALAQPKPSSSRLTPP